MKPAVIFVAGPIRADSAWDREQNIRRAEALALEVWRRGAAAICVHAAGRFYDETEARTNGWIELDHELVRRCDALIVAKGWQFSTGTQVEMELALTLGLPVLHDLQALDDWLAFRRSKAQGEIVERASFLEALEWHRAGGGATCGRCGKEFVDHPMGGVGGWPGGRPFLHRLCDGSLVKL